MYLLWRIRDSLARIRDWIRGFSFYINYDFVPVKARGIRAYYRAEKMHFVEPISILIVNRRKKPVDFEVEFSVPREVCFKIISDVAYGETVHRREYRRLKPGDPTRIVVPVHRVVPERWVARLWFLPFYCCGVTEPIDRSMKDTVTITVYIVKNKRHYRKYRLILPVEYYKVARNLDLCGETPWIAPPSSR